VAPTDHVTMGARII